MTNSTREQSPDSADDMLGSPVPEGRATLTKAEASEHIDRLQKGNPRTIQE